MPRGAPRLRTADKKRNQLGTRMRERRRYLKLTQDSFCAQLAQITEGEWNPDRKEIYRIEVGLRIVSDLEIFVLANALDVSPCWLLTGDIEEKPT